MTLPESLQQSLRETHDWMASELGFALVRFPAEVAKEMEGRGQIARDESGMYVYVAPPGEGDPTREERA